MLLKTNFTSSKKYNYESENQHLHVMKYNKDHVY
jgi:hypothetical protein